jgi:hypothetical protein
MFRKISKYRIITNIKNKNACYMSKNGFGHGYWFFQ